MGGVPSLARVQQKSDAGSKKTPTRTQANHISITHPPGSPGVSPIYQKYLNATDACILALSDVSDEAMIQARDIPYGMVSTRPDLRIFILDDRTISLPQLSEFIEWSLAEHRKGGFAVDGSVNTILLRHLTDWTRQCVTFSVRWGPDAVKTCRDGRDGDSSVCFSASPHCAGRSGCAADVDHLKSDLTSIW